MPDWSSPRTIGQAIVACAICIWSMARIVSKLGKAEADNQPLESRGHGQNPPTMPRPPPKAEPPAPQKGSRSQIPYRTQHELFAPSTARATCGESYRGRFFMVFVNPPSDGGTGIWTETGPLGMSLPGFVGSQPDDGTKKIRKPYTITKSRESWSEQEHDKFLEALQLFNRDWKKIEAFVGSKTVIQIRSHAQKYFLKVQKNGTVAHVPPPRPKRKAAHPYPQKASKNAPQTAQRKPFQVSYFHEQGYIFGTESSSLLRNSCTAMPDFVQVYNFLGSVFDPSTRCHLQKLKEMDPVDVETALLLMRNLSINLTSPDFEAHMKLLAGRV